MSTSKKYRPSQFVLEKFSLPRAPVERSEQRNLLGLRRVGGGGGCDGREGDEGGEGTAAEQKDALS